MTNETTKAAEIAKLNDAFRAGFNSRGRRMMTVGISSLPLLDQLEIGYKTQAFAAFTPENDPYGEHDFGSFQHSDKKIFWKIDTFADERMEWGAEDHTDPKAYRVLTIMLASEY